VKPKDRLEQVSFKSRHDPEWFVVFLLDQTRPVSVLDGSNNCLIDQTLVGS
jgi:hypothetical protein